MIENRLPKIEKQLTLEELLPLRSLGSSCRTIITPTDRLARFLKNYEHERNKGITRPGHNIIDYKTWIKTIWDEQLQLQDPRLLLSKSQEQALWTSIIEENKSKRSLINIFDTAQSLSQARKLLYQFRCFHCNDGDLAKLSDEDIDFLSRAKSGRLADVFYNDPDRDFFLEMHSQYRKKCQENGWIDTAELPDIIIDAIREAIREGKTTGIAPEIIFAGFSNTEPQTVALKDVLKDALKVKGGNAYFAEIASEDIIGDFQLITDKGSATTSPVSPFLSPEYEYKACAAWAIDKLQKDDGKIYAILAPNLEEISDDIRTVLDKYLCPEIILPENRLLERPYNISYGKPLISYYPISLALLGLELAFKGLPIKEMGHFLLSPCFIPQPANASSSSGNSSAEPKPLTPDDTQEQLAEQARVVHDHLSKRSAFYAKLRQKLLPHVYIDDIEKILSGNNELKELKELIARFGVLRPDSSWLSQNDNLKGLAKNAPEPLKLSQWPEFFFAILKELHFMEGLQSSGTNQLIDKLMQAINGLKCLDNVCPENYTGAEALAFLRSALSQTLFQPRTAKAKRLQVMGFMEAQGQKFEEVRIINFQDRAWPANSAPSPYLPYSLQKCFGMPNSSPEANLYFSKHITESLKKVALKGQASWSRSNGSSDKLEEYRLSPLYLTLTNGSATEDIWSEKLKNELSTWPERISQDKNYLHEYKQRADEEIALQPDDDGNYAQKGGTRVIEAWAQCPFRAFAELRLGAKALEDIEQYPGKREKGTLIHNIMQFFWTGTYDKEHSPELEKLIDTAIASSEALMAGWKDERERHEGGCRTLTKLIELRGDKEKIQLEESDLVKVVSICTDIFIKNLAIQKPHISQTFLNIEKERIVKLISVFLDYETGRRPFKVIAAEEKKEIKIPLPEESSLKGSLKINAKIDRIDEYINIDGGLCIIDYKTGNKDKDETAWKGKEKQKQDKNKNSDETDYEDDEIKAKPLDRIKEPQVPIYAAFANDNDNKTVVRASFANINPYSANRFAGTGISDPSIDGADTEAKSALLSDLDYWKETISGIAKEFCEGNASVSPLDDGWYGTCAYCKLSSLCRKLIDIDEDEKPEY